MKNYKKYVISLFLAWSVAFGEPENLCYRCFEHIPLLSWFESWTTISTYKKHTTLSIRQWIVLCPVKSDGIV